MVYLFSFLLLEDCLFSRFKERCKVDGRTERHFFACQANFQTPLHTALCAWAPLCLCSCRGRVRSPLTPTAHSHSSSSCHQHHPPWGFTACQKNLQGKGDGTFLIQSCHMMTLPPQRRSLLHIAPFSAQQKRKVVEEQGLSGYKIS